MLALLLKNVKFFVYFLCAQQITLRQSTKRYIVFSKSEFNRLPDHNQALSHEIDTGEEITKPTLESYLTTLNDRAGHLHSGIVVMSRRYHE